MTKGVLLVEIQDELSEGLKERKGVCYHVVDKETLGGLCDWKHVTKDVF